MRVEVKKQLSPAKSPSSPPVVSNSAASYPSNLAELPLVLPEISQPPVPSALAPVAETTFSENHSAKTPPQQWPGIPVFTLGLANAVIQHSIAMAQSSLAGEPTSQAPTLPSEFVNSPSLPRELL